MVRHVIRLRARERGSGLMLRDNEVLKKMIATGEERMSKLASQLLQNETFMGALQKTMSAALDVNGGDTRGLLLRTRSSLGAPTTGTWSKGTMILDSAADLFICTAPGTPGTWIKVGAP